MAIGWGALLALVPQQTIQTALPQSAKLAEPLGQFALDLYRTLDDAPGNLLVSPYSIAEVLAMASTGARGETRAEFERVLHLPGPVSDEFAVAARALVPPSLRDGPAYELRIASSMWTQSGYEFVPDFLAGLKRGFAAQPFEVDFKRSEEARKQINAWVARETRDKIPELFGAGTPDDSARLVLVNAVYLKADWETPFEAHRTHPKPFHTAAGKDVQGPAMARVGSMLYGESELAQRVVLPYRGELEMLVVLPKQQGGLAAVIEAEGLLGAGELAPCEVQLQLPKFTFRSRHDLKSPLGALGLKRAFDATNADFTGIAPGDKLCVQAVVHEAFVAVDEKGTEAAAATGLVVGITSAPERERPIPFVADHPFLFVLRHRTSGLVLFVGRVDDPTVD